VSHAIVQTCLFFAFLSSCLLTSLAGLLRTAIYAFALVVCQRSDGRFLLVQEFCNSGFWLPGGRVDPGASSLLPLLLTPRLTDHL
jgi:hypothetical protein